MKGMIILVKNLIGNIFNRRERLERYEEELQEVNWLIETEEDFISSKGYMMAEREAELSNDPTYYYNDEWTKAEMTEEEKKLDDMIENSKAVIEGAEKHKEHLIENCKNYTGVSYENFLKKVESENKNHSNSNSLTNFTKQFGKTKSRTKSKEKSEEMTM